MPVTVDRKQLKAGLARVKRAVTRYAPFVDIELDGDGGCLTFTTDDGDMRISTRVPYVSVTDEFATCRVRHGVLSRFVNTDDGEAIAIQSRADHVKQKLDVVVMGDATMTLRDVYRPGITPVDERYSYALDRIITRPDVTTWKADPYTVAALRAALSASSSDEGRPILNRVQIEDDGAVVATDSYRLMRWQVEPPPVTTAIPGDAIRAIPERASDVLVSVSPNALWLELACDDGTTIIVQGLIALEGEFPSWRTLFSTNQPIRLQFDRDVLLSALRGFVTASNYEPVRFNYDGDDTVRLALTTKGDVEIELERAVPCTIPDDAFASQVLLAFNPEYLRDAVRSVPGPVVQVRIVDALKPALITDPEATHTTLLMPVRVA